MTSRIEATFDTVQALLRADDLSDLTRIFGVFARSFGTQSWATVELSRGMGIIPGMFREFGESPVDWLSRFRQQGYASDDLACFEILRADMAFFLSDLANDPRLNARGRFIMEERIDFGLKHGVVTPIHLADGSTWGLCCWGEAIEKEESVIPAISLAAHVYTACAARMDGAVRLARGQLTPRMLEIIDLLRAGRKQTEIASVLGISVRTVENLMREARERTQSHTTAALVAIYAHGRP